MKINSKLFIEKSPELFLFGSIIILIGLTIPQFTFTGFEGEPYSPLNHFVSELGWMNVSESAFLFNICLFIGGILLIPFMIYLKKMAKHNLMKLGSIFGIISAVGCIFVAVFPMNIEILFQHALSAATFFIGSATMMIMFSFAILREENSIFPKKFAINGIIIACLNISLVLVDATEPVFNMIEFNVGEYLGSNIRPDFWLITFIEWLIVLSILIGLMMMAFYLKCHRKNTMKKN